MDVNDELTARAVQRLFEIDERLGEFKALTRNLNDLLVELVPNIIASPTLVLAIVAPIAG